jgi:hypothetical protein
MTMLSPAATYHAQLREQLESVARALSAQRGLLWLARGLVVGSVIVLGLVIWAWTTDTVRTLPIPFVVAIPIVAALVMALGSLVVRHNSRELASRVDRAARLQERSTTALELGARGEEFPLAIAQMRDAVEHLKRVDLLEAFPLRVPRNELLTTFFTVLIAAIVAISPNPWLLRARASNPTITIAREQAQRVQRLADSIQPDSAETNALRQLISNGAKTMEARSNEPDAALNALQDLEQQVQNMSAGDDQLSAALAAIASALAGNQTTQSLADAINTGDMRQISQAAKDLAQDMASLTPQEQQQVAQALRDAATRAARVSQSVANNLTDAANGLDAAAMAAGDQSQAGQGDQSQAGQADGQQQGAASAMQAATNAMNQLSNSAAAADARQRTASQLESSRNALERALGQTQSRLGNSNSSASSRSSSQNGQGSQQNGQNSGQSPDGAGQGQGADQNGAGGDQNGAGQQGTDGGNGSDTGQGGGYSTGGNGQGQSNSGAASQLDVITSPQQVPTNGDVTPDQSSINPYTSNAGGGNAQTAPENVQPNYSNRPTQGNDSGSIPLGLRDLVKNYFSSLDQK